MGQQTILNRLNENFPKATKGDPAAMGTVFQQMHALMLSEVWLTQGLMDRPAMAKPIAGPMPDVLISLFARFAAVTHDFQRNGGKFTFGQKSRAPGCVTHGLPLPCRRCADVLADEICPPVVPKEDPTETPPTPFGPPEGGLASPEHAPPLTPVGLPKEIEVTDRYEAFGIPRPDPKTMCPGQCEGTGKVPVRKEDANDSEGPWHDLWLRAEHFRASADTDGVHIVTCPACKGTGKAPEAPDEDTPTEDEEHQNAAADCDEADGQAQEAVASE
jgi:hypothetical protein